MSQIERLEYLLTKYFNATATSSEEEELFKIIRQSDYDSEVKQFMDDAWSKLSGEHRLTDTRSRAVFENILHSALNAERITGNVKTMSFPWKRLAAAVFFAVIAGSVLFLLLADRSQSISATTENKPPPINEIAAPANKTLLTFSDQTVVDLDTVKGGVFFLRDGIAVSKTADGQLEYRLSGAGKQSAATEFHTITTATGSQYEILLPDRTKVWLNAESTLRYPLKFSDSAKIVQLHGEAYFEVATTFTKTATGRSVKVPFFVDAGNAQVSVLGTHFNVMAYDTEKTVKTTLVEGEVKVRTANGERLLQPGQQAEVLRNGSITFHNDVSVKNITAWKSGLFDFRNEDIQTIMRELQRWYPMKVSFNGSIPDQHFTGSIRRQVELSKVLHMLQLVGHFKFVIEDGRVIISSK